MGLNRLSQMNLEISDTLDRHDVYVWEYSTDLLPPPSSLLHIALCKIHQVT